MRVQSTVLQCSLQYGSFVQGVGKDKADEKLNES